MSLCSNIRLQLDVKTENCGSLNDKSLVDVEPGAALVLPLLPFHVQLVVRLVHLTRMSSVSVNQCCESSPSIRIDPNHQKIIPKLSKRRLNFVLRKCNMAIFCS